MLLKCKEEWLEQLELNETSFTYFFHMIRTDPIVLKIYLLINLYHSRSWSSEGWAVGFLYCRVDTPSLVFPLHRIAIEEWCDFFLKDTIEQKVINKTYTTPNVEIVLVRTRTAYMEPYSLKDLR